MFPEICRHSVDIFTGLHFSLERWGLHAVSLLLFPQLWKSKRNITTVIACNDEQHFREASMKPERHLSNEKCRSGNMSQKMSPNFREYIGLYSLDILGNIHILWVKQGLGITTICSENIRISLIIHIHCNIYTLVRTNQSDEHTELLSIEWMHDCSRKAHRCKGDNH